MRLVEIFDDGERLQQHLAAVQRERRHPPLWIDGPIFRRVLAPAVLGEMYRCGVEGDALEVERDAGPVGGGRAEIGIELHGSSLGVSLIGLVVYFAALVSAAVADKIPDCSVRRATARSKAARSAGSMVSNSRWAK